MQSRWKGLANEKNSPWYFHPACTAFHSREILNRYTRGFVTRFKSGRGINRGHCAFFTFSYSTHALRGYTCKEGKKSAVCMSPEKSLYYSILCASFPRLARPFLFLLGIHSLYLTFALSLSFSFTRFLSLSLFLRCTKIWLLTVCTN